MISKANAMYARIAPRKARVVADLVRGKDVADAVMTLEFLRKSAAPVVKKVIEHIHANIEKNITLKDTSEKFCYSPNYMGLLFKQVTGQHFSDYVRDAKLDRAAELLKDPTKRAYEVAYGLGYNKLTYFCKRFKKKFGMSPTNYRNKQ